MKAISIFAGFLILGCAREHSTSELEPPGLQGAQSPHGSDDGPMLLAQTSLLPGTTAVDPSAARVLLVTHNQRSHVEAMLDELGARSVFITEAGQRIPTSSEIVSLKGESVAGIVIGLRPRSELETDHWYTFQLEE